jgi:hypothetical protein
MRRQFAMKAGTPIPGLNFLKGKDPVVALERSEYPAWIKDLTKNSMGLTPLSALRKLKFSEDNLSDYQRYTKLERRIIIKTNNSEANEE